MSIDVYKIGDYGNWPAWMLQWRIGRLKFKIADADARIAIERQGSVREQEERHRRGQRAIAQLARHQSLLGNL